MELIKPNHPTIVFDFGGVLIDWDPRYLYRKFFDGEKEAMERFLAEIRFYEWNQQQDAGRPFAQAVTELCAQYPHYAELIKAYDLHWEESLAGPIQPSVDILRELKEAGYHLYGLSNWSAEKFPLVKNKYGFFNWFEDIVLSGEVQLVKPDPRIFTLMLRKIKRPAQECLLIDDSSHNILAARQLGFQTILFQSPEQLRQALGPMILP